MTYNIDTFNEYQEGTNATAVYPKSTPRDSLNYVTLGLNGEAGEVADHIKKWQRKYPDDVDGLHLDVQPLILEMGDVLYYLAQLAERLGTDLAYVAWANREKLAARAVQGTLKERA